MAGLLEERGHEIAAAVGEAEALHVAVDAHRPDVAIIDTGRGDVSYAHRLMNLCMGIAVNPASGEISVIGTDGTNEKRFEPVLTGVFLRVNLALVDPVTRTNRLLDLNPHLDYVARTLPPEQRALSVGDPRGIEWNAAGTRAYITGMGSRNLIMVDADGHHARLQRRWRFDQRDRRVEDRQDPGELGELGV